MMLKEDKKCNEDNDIEMIDTTTSPNKKKEKSIKINIG